MSHVPVVAGPDLSIADMVSRVFDLTDLKPATRKTYMFAAKSFITWASGRALHARILVEYKDALRAQPALSAKTKNLYLAVARTVFRELFALGILPFDASKAVKAFEIGSGHKRSPVTDKQVTRAFQYAERRRDLRLALMLNLLFRQGLRQKEVVDIQVEHYDESGGTLAILGKGRDDRERVHLHPETARALTAYLSECGIKGGFVFGSQKRRGTHITTNTLYSLIRQVHAACGIVNSPHSWRKVFASKLIESGMNLFDVQAYTRHRSLGQLRVYADRIAIRKTLPTYYEAFKT